jgi:molecular chaperone GrpE (heat shock protein)
MEALKDQQLAEGSALVSSAEVVSAVLHKNSSNIFLKNIGMQPISPTKQPTTKERVLQEQLANERQGAAALQAEVDLLKQKSKEIEEALERTQRDMQEYKRTMEENSTLLQTVLRLNGAAGFNLNSAAGP